MIGFIGLGIMGKPMAKNLLKAGFSLNIYDINETAAEEVAQAGGKRCSSPGGCRKQRYDPHEAAQFPQDEGVLMGKNGVLEGMKPGSIVVDMSSIDPGVSVELEKVVSAAGGEMIDAPVSGGEPKAKDATLSFMCGGKEEVFAQVKPVLEKMGASVVLTGPIGSGNMTKLANQIIVAVNIAALSEALVLAAKSGVNPENVYNAIKGGLAGSTVMNAKAPMMLDRCFDPGFRIELHIKDLKNAVNASQAVDMELPLTQAVLGMMNHLKDEGLEKCDHSAILRYYEEKEQVEVKR